MQHDAWFRNMFTRRSFRSCALIIGTALGLSLAGAPSAATSAQVDNQWSAAAGEVIDEIVINAVTQRTCAGGVCACQAGETVVGGGARCMGLDTLQESFPVAAPTPGWRAQCVRLLEVRRSAIVQTAGGAGASEPVVVDTHRFAISPASTHVICSTP